ncbi:MauE/DoxX family redox-associated membrane protein [Actinomadura macrotermitis]|uniref:Methylamine utilisation protein MauE domain-containing protein n=1 Tax=Actinomadura macrotermitis TaxID=2585200 RepID=A0A7K0C3W0_9ACTN|nr:MauE/DoxX family redox-associated membrane protein [Actinomadura macrotermitis]MQY08140.1 hypothetical protein [Actinomadura macrotermitis]
MRELLAGVAAVAVPLVFLASLYGQVRRPGALPAALRAQRVLPAGLTVPGAALAIAAEAAAGASVLAGLVSGAGAVLRLGMGLGAVLLAGYALYAAYVSRVRSGVPCGCAGDGTPMTGWVAARAAALAALALAGALAGPAPMRAVAVVAGLAFAVLLWTLPQAMSYERTTAG